MLLHLQLVDHCFRDLLVDCIVAFPRVAAQGFEPLGNFFNRNWSALLMRGSSFQLNGTEIGALGFARVENAAIEVEPRSFRR